MNQQTDYHSSWSYDNSPPPRPYHDGGNNFNHGGGVSNGGHYNNHRRYQNHYQDAGEPTDSYGYTNIPAFAGRKRNFTHEYSEGSGCVKLNVSSVPREVTEEDIRSLFGEHGNVTEVILFKQIRHLQQQEGCFVKYANIEDAAQAIEALHINILFLGYASNSKKQERPRWGPGLVPGPSPGAIGCLETHLNKVFVNFMNKHASKAEIAEIFTPYGYVKEVFLLFDEERQYCGRGYITFTDNSMATAAVNGLNGKYVMKGCDQPMFVRLAGPRRPKFGENRYGSYASDPVSQTSLPNTSHRSPLVSSTCSVPTEPECDWSEHICPDGNAYYYNCVTCESLWEKPEEYSFFEQQLENGTQQSNSPWSSW